ncbi:hypothetical protein [Streptomyces sp. NPDC057617]|uniref:hypothetical protein n=1 Tax=Streptomyces sp. NPDC057617 TaxID=3346184 RepID=UPI0036ACC85A
MEDADGPGAGDFGEVEGAGDFDGVGEAEDAPGTGAPGRSAARTAGSFLESATAGAGAGERTSKPVAKATVAENAERVTDLVIIQPP